MNNSSQHKYVESQNEFPMQLHAGTKSCYIIKLYCKTSTAKITMYLNVTDLYR